MSFTRLRQIYQPPRARTLGHDMNVLTLKPRGGVTSSTNAMRSTVIFIYTVES